jgi:hypothetical protein
LGNGLEQAGRTFWADNPQGVRIEGKGKDSGAQADSLQLGRAEDVLMAEMNAIKHAQGDTRA